MVRACDDTPVGNKWFTAFWTNDDIMDYDNNLKGTLISYEISDDSTPHEVPSQQQKIPLALTSEEPMVQVFGERAGQSPCRFYSVMIYESGPKCEPKGNIRYFRAN